MEHKKDRDLHNGLSRDSMLLFFLLLIAIVCYCTTGCAVPSPEPEEPEIPKVVVETMHLTESTDILEIDLQYPAVSGFKGASQLSKQIRSDIDASIKEIRIAAEDNANSGGHFNKAGLYSTYQYSNNGDLLSIWIQMSNYTGGAHGLSWLNSYTVNTRTGEQYTFRSLFQEGSDYKSLVTDQIIAEIQANPNNFFPDAAESVASLDGNYKFYINGNQIVVYFTLYELAPYVVGIPTFTFTAEELRSILKPEVYDSIKNGVPVSTSGALTN